MVQLVQSTTSPVAAKPSKRASRGFAAGSVIRLDSFRKLQAWGIPVCRLLTQDKGQ